MDNSDLWYTESNLMLLFGYACKSSVKNLRKDVTTRKFSNRYLYLKKDIYRLLDERYQTKEERELLRTLIARIETYGINFENWIPLSEALKIVQFSRQRLYQLKDAGRVETKEYDGFLLFNKEELEGLSIS